MATVNVVRGSADEAILRAQYGDTVKFNYTNQNQFAGADRAATNKMYQSVLGAPTNDAGNLWNYQGVALQAGGKLPNDQIQLNQTKSALDGQLATQTNMYNQQAEQQEAKIRQAIASQAQRGDATKADYANNMNAAIGTLNTEKAKIPGQVTNLNNAASSAGMMNAQKIRNSLAQMGLLQSGASATQQLLNNTTVANNVNANNLQGQELEADYGMRIATAQTDLASKVKQINDAIALAQSQGDENAMLVLRDAQAKIANAAAKTDVDYNNWAYTMGRDTVNDRMTQQEMEARAIQDAITNAYNQSQADIKNRQWQDSFDTGNDQWNKTFAADQANRAATLARSSAPKAPTATQIKANYTSQAYNDIQSALDRGASPEQVKQSILSRSSDYAQMGINVNTLISQVDAIAKSWGKYDDDTARENPTVAASKAASAWNSLNNMWNR